MNEISSFYVMELMQRAKQLESQGMDVIHMEIGEPDFATPTEVIKAGQHCLKQGKVKYTAAAGLPQLREAISDHYQQQYNIAIEKQRIFITPGASGAFLLALGVNLNPGDEILMADPCYPCNSTFVHLFNAHSQLIDVDDSSNYQLNAKLISDNWQHNSQGVLVASPSNPTGTVIDEAVLQTAIEETLALEGCFFSDEIYHGLVYEKKAASALQFSPEVFVINSFSKFFGMTGWRVGWLVVPDKFIDPVERLAQNIFISTPTLSQYAALASFSPQNQRELERRRREFAARRDFLYDQLIRLGFKINCKPQGAFYIYADCSAFTDNSFQWAKDLLETEYVAVTPGKDFGHNKENLFIRLAYTASIKKMSEAIDRLQHFLYR